MEHDLKGRSDFIAERRHRKPPKGFRLKFRTEARSRGVEGKFGTELLKRNVLFCSCRDEATCESVVAAFPEGYEGWTIQARVRPR